MLTATGLHFEECTEGLKVESFKKLWINLWNLFVVQPKQTSSVKETSRYSLHHHNTLTNGPAGQYITLNRPKSKNARYSKSVLEGQ